MISAPLVMPEVILGLSLLLMFVSLGVARGYWTIVIAHTTFAMCYVTVVVQSRLLTFDRSLEEAAMDLGAPPLKTFFVVTLPLIAPALIGGWLLAFTLSLDDLVVASFTTGPGATTLPMRIYSSVRLGVTPEINAVCTVLIALRHPGRDHRLARPEEPLRPLGRGRGRPALTLRPAAPPRTPRPWPGSAPPSSRARWRAPASAAWRGPIRSSTVGGLVQDLLRRAPVVEPQQQRDQPLDQHGIAVGAQMDPPAGLGLGHQPDLALAAAHLVALALQRLGQRRQVLAELDQVLDLVAPVVEQGELVLELAGGVGESWGLCSWLALICGARAAGSTREPRMPLRILVFQHHPASPAGLVGERMAARGAEVTTLDAEHGIAMPARRRRAMTAC